MIKFSSKFSNQSQAGFTLMEIMVSVTIFAATLVLMMTLFNYTLRINRRVEALRQATQATRNFTEFLVKEIRNGKVDYAPVSGQCASTYSNTGTSYLGLVNIDGDHECFYLTNGPLGPLTVLMLQKNNLAAEALNPPNFKIASGILSFFVRPSQDPYSSPSHIQPLVSLYANFTETLPTGETVTIPYQTSVSSDVYDIP